MFWIVRLECSNLTIFPLGADKRTLLSLLAKFPLTPLYNISHTHMREKLYLFIPLCSFTFNCPFLYFLLGPRTVFLRGLGKRKRILVLMNTYSRLERLLRDLLCFLRSQLISLDVSEEELTRLTQPVLTVEIYRYPSCTSRSVSQTGPTTYLSYNISKTQPT